MIPVNTKTASDMPALLRDLGKPFEPGCVGWKPGSVTKDGRKAMALAYIDSRDVMDRLDTVLGPDCWRDEYEVLQAGAVRCRLSLRVGGEWVAKEDVGGASAQPDPGDKMKAAFSDALKRAAVKWGIGRYLYHLDAAWCEYDAQRKQFSRTPTLPAWALPGGTGRPPTYSLPPHLAAEQDAPVPAGSPQPRHNEGPAKPPAATTHHKENPAVRAIYAQRYATAKTGDEYKGIRADLSRDVAEGIITDAETKARLGLTKAAAQ